ncbi:MAG: hypothetical protein K9H64_12795 [Bacteroidales bacterium]|nr:hypothetical protein [Bacteroidales bacterium]MCF8456924.1 hypothetical protein [Bacteroidales bacterium]
MKIKKLLSVLLPLCLFSVLLVQGQNIQLTFTGMDNDIPVQLESIHVYNLTRNIGPIVLSPGSTLILDKSLTFLPSKVFSMELISNHPVKDMGHINVYVPEMDRVTISASNMLGRHQNLFSGFLEEGYHSFYLTPGTEDLIVITAIWRTSYTSLKIISSNTIDGAEPAIVYKGTMEMPPEGYISASVTIPYADGDQLYFEGFAGDDRYVLNASPGESQNLQLKKKPTPTPPPPPPPSTACPGTPTVTYAGKTYNTVQIGTQCWLKENLDVGVMKKSFNTGVLHQETSDNGVIEKYCYQNKTSNCSTFGGLYNWSEMVQYYNGATDETLWGPGMAPVGNFQGICPTGWHIPTNDEWLSLTTYLGGEAVAGDKMKSTSTQAQIFWTGGVGTATNSSDFTGLPAGIRVYYGNFSDQHMRTHYWSIDEAASISYPGTVVGRNSVLMYNTTSLLNNTSWKSLGFSVRCLKD